MYIRNCTAKVIWKFATSYFDRIMVRDLLTEKGPLGDFLRTFRVVWGSSSVVYCGLFKLLTFYISILPIYFWQKNYPKNKAKIKNILIKTVNITSFHIAFEYTIKQVFLKLVCWLPCRFINKISDTMVNLSLLCKGINLSDNCLF